MTLAITHTPAEGTLINGTTRGDGTAEILKTNGWRFSRNLDAWYVPRSRDTAPKTPLITRTTDQLRNAGYTVEITLDTTTRTTADIEHDLTHRRTNRANALTHKAERTDIKALAAAKNADRAHRRLPEGGEPVKIGHHSETRHRNALAKAEATTRKSIEADAEARRAHARADIAAQSNDARYAPVTVANRIKKLRAEHALWQRRIDEATTPEYLDRINAELSSTADQLGYWEAVRAEQITNGTVTDYSRENVAPGDHIYHYGAWYLVTRTNPKSVTVTGREGRGGTILYTHIKKHQTAAR